MPEPIFPSLIGLTYPIIRKPLSSTIVQVSANGLETRIGNYAYPRYEWDLSHAWLNADPAVADFQTLFGFCDKIGGMRDAFLFSDDTDKAVTGQPIGTGDGVTTVFQLLRTFGGSTGAVYAPKAAGMVIYLAGVPWTTYTLDTLTGLITFASAVGGGTAITADYSYYWRCRMLQDDPEFREFDNGGWEAQSLKWTSVRA